MQRLFYQENAYRALDRLMAGGRFPHALLLEGAPGSGKRTLAAYAAAMLLCRGEGAPPCGACRSCRKLESGNHPDLTVVDGRVKKAFAIDAVRALRQDAWVAPNESAYRVLLLADVQNMDPKAQNALLKILEEPPAHIRFVLTATNRGALLDTILSRTTRINLDELSPAQREEALAALRPALPAEDRKRAALAFETVGQALLSLSDDKTKRRLSDAGALLERLAAHERYGLLCTLAGYEGDRDGLLETLSLLRTLCVARLTGEKSDFSALQCAQIVAIIEKSQERIRQNVGLPLLSAVLASELVDAVSPVRG